MRAPGNDTSRWQEAPQHPEAGRARAIVNDGVAFASGNSVAIIFQVIAGLLTARFLLPKELGLFNGIGLALGYATLLQLGVLNGLNRELPFLWGKGEASEARNLAETAFAFCVTLGALVGGGFWAVAFGQLLLGDTRAAGAWLAWGLVAILTFTGDHFFPILYKTTSHFGLLARVTTLRSLVNLLLVSLVAAFGYLGLCLKTVLVATVQLLLLLWKRPLIVWPKLRMRSLTKLIKIGFPIFAVGQLYSLWLLGNNTLVLRFAGARGFGLYSLVLVVSNLAAAFPIATGQVIYPRMVMAWGRGSSERDLMKMAVFPTILSLCIVAPAIIVGWMLSPWAIQWILPKYVGAIPATRWALLSGLTACFTPINNIFNVLERQRLYATAMVIGIAAHGATLLLMTTRLSTLPLERFVQALLVGQLTFALASYAILLWLLLFRWQSAPVATSSKQSHEEDRRDG